MKRGYEGVVRFHVEDREREYLLELWQQPFLRWIVAAVYHWYNMRVWKVPGMRWIDNHTGSIKGDTLKLGWSTKQDIRDYHLTEKCRVVVATVSIDEETFAKLHPIFIV